MVTTPLNWDSRLFLLINGHASSWLDYLLGWTTYLGEYYIILPLTLVYMLIWHERREAARYFAVVCICVASAGLLTQALKALFLRPRPWVYFMDDILRGSLTVHCLFHIRTARSFPSGHTTAIFALAVALIGLYGRRMRFMLLLAGLVGLSRIYCGAHFPSDVLAGAIIGSLFSYATLVAVRDRVLAPEFSSKNP